MVFSELAKGATSCPPPRLCATARLLSRYNPHHILTAYSLPAAAIVRLGWAGVNGGDVVTSGAIIHPVMMRYLRERGEKAAKKAGDEWASAIPPESV